MSSDPIKRRHQQFRRLYNFYYEWGALIEAGETDHFITTSDGEEVYRGDLLIGLDSLKENQSVAFELLCLRGMTETQAIEEHFKGRVVPVQQHADTALKKMVKAYDEQQRGRYISPEKKRRLQELDKQARERRREANGQSPNTTISASSRLGSRQKEILKLLEENQQYFKGCGWKYSSHSETIEILDSLVSRELVLSELPEDGIIVYTLP